MISTIFQDDREPVLCCAACINFAGNLAQHTDQLVGGVAFRQAMIRFLREVADEVETDLTKELH